MIEQGYPEDKLKEIVKARAEVLAKIYPGFKNFDFMTLGKRGWEEESKQKLQKLKQEAEKNWLDLTPLKEKTIAEKLSTSGDSIMLGILN